MTIEETTKILSVLRLAYPTFCAKTDELKATAKLWGDLFHGEDYLLVGAAVKSFIVSDEKGFPPVPGQIMAKLRALSPRYEGEIAAWARVRKALRDASPYRYINSDGTLSPPGYVLAFRRLPPIIQQALGSPETLLSWANQSSDTLDITYHTFVRAYNALAERGEEYTALTDRCREALPDGVRERLDDICQRQ